MNIQELVKKSNEEADRIRNTYGEHYPDWHSFRDSIFAALVLEEAAKVCDERNHNWRWDDEPDSPSGPRECAAAIRALKGAKE